MKYPSVILKFPNKEIYLEFKNIFKGFCFFREENQEYFLKTHENFFNKYLSKYNSWIVK